MKFLKTQTLSKYGISDTKLIANPYGRYILSGTGGLRIPAGLQTERPQLTGVDTPGGANGYIRFNSSAGTVEAYIGSAWETLGTSSSLSYTPINATEKGQPDGVATLDSTGRVPNTQLDADLTSIAELTGTTGLLKKTATNTWVLDTTAYLSSIDADLTAIANLTGTTGLLKKTATNTWVLDTTDYLTTADAALGYQPLDADLTSIATISSTSGFLKKVSANNWGLDSTQYQPLDSDLTSIAGLIAPVGLLKKTATNTWTLDTTAYITAADKSASASSIEQGIVFNSTTSTGGGAGRISFTTAAQDGIINFLLAPNVTAGDTVSFITGANLSATSFTPGTTSTQELGSFSKRWKTLYLDQASNAMTPALNLANISGNNTGIYSTSDGQSINFSLESVDLYKLNLIGVIPALTNELILGSDTNVWKSSYVGAGSVSQPSINISNAGGLYSSGTDKLGISVNSKLIAEYSSSGLKFNGITLPPLKIDVPMIRLDSGDESTPGFSISRLGETDINTGLFRDGNSLAITVVGIKTADFDLFGNLSVTSNIVSLSDQRLKTDIAVIKDALSKVSKLSGYTFLRTDTNIRQTGLIAQEVEKVMPEAINYGEKYMSVAYGNLVGLLVEAVKELSAKVDALSK